MTNTQNLTSMGLAQAHPNNVKILFSNTCMYFKFTGGLNVEINFTSKNEYQNYLNTKILMNIICFSLIYSFLIVTERVATTVMARTRFRRFVIK